MKLRGARHSFLFSAAVVSLPRRVDAFVAQPIQLSVPPTLRRSASAHLARDEDEVDDATSMDGVARPWVNSATSAVLAASLLAAPLLLPPSEAWSAPAAPPEPSPSSRTATSINIDLRSVPALTRRVVANRDKLTGYVLDSFRSLKPILDVLSESDAVTVAPPADIKGAIDQALTQGDARFLVNGEPVDVRVESVPGVILVRVTSPRLPRLPFLRDGTAALRFADGIVDQAPRQLEKAADEVQALERFLTWGAPGQAPLRYRGSAAERFLSAEAGLPGPLGGLTRGGTALLSTGLGVAGAYGASYAYYVGLREEADREAAEKKAKAAAAKKAKAAVAKKTKAAAAKKAKADAAKKERAKEMKAEAAEEAKMPETLAASAMPPEAEVEVAAAGAGTAAESEEDGGPGETMCDGGGARGRKRDAFMRMFRRGNER